ncbi:EAL domain-containing protein [Pseudophaeobacter sp. TrK17]|uniref:EAL domain-containing protein n=1 Tax=Pseudophaeobacter sp. TrK17 TaxID=2815167 RepID=UPI0035D0D6FD
MGGTVAQKEFFHNLHLELPGVSKKAITVADLEKCKACRNGNGFEIPISMAFQPIVSVGSGKVFAYEALVRGQDGCGAGQVFEQVTDDNLYAFDQKCRKTAIEHASRLDLGETGSLLSINFLPNAVYDPKACIRLTLETAKKTGFPLSQIMFEFTEVERISVPHLLNILNTYRRLGFLTAIDDFGAGYAGLDLLSRFQPDVVKLDAELIREIDSSSVKQTIVRHVVSMLEQLGIIVVAEGIETEGEFSCLYDLGIDLMQGWLFAKPGFESLPGVRWPQALVKPDSSRSA